ncbi:hypothetical protein GCM10009641_07440 [Mycobacterium cookii]|uniref:Uncharacterized protein n=1 Tax=Mycobacterium cookii TaxID=1775 RepID=A0A7I7L356_9MYCO|nr:hypothetical protein MCOO_42260 [Mycobacterium cookii]
MGSSSSVASARAAATMVAVAPTLEAKSQLSVSLRGIVTLPVVAVGFILSQGKELPKLYAPTLCAAHPICR